MDANFKLLANRKIVDILIGDVGLGTFKGNKISMPYLSGPKLCSLCNMHGLYKTYSYGGANCSRWQYMTDLIIYLDKDKKVQVLLKYLYDFDKFDNIRDLGNVEEIKVVYKTIVENSIKAINKQLIYSGKELKLINNNFYLTSIGTEPILETPQISEINIDYILSLKERIKEDIENENYDSVVTKSRTTIEEVLIYVIEKNNIEPSTKGNLPILYNQFKAIYNMNQNVDWDKCINSMLSGLEKIIHAISEMRNINSDSHGVGSKRIKIKKREAKLIANTSMALCEYLLSIYKSK